MKTLIAGLTGLALAASAAQAKDWIDLGDEGATLHLSADYVPANPPAAAELILATSSGQERCRLGIDAKGKTHLWLYQKTVEGPVIDPTKKQLLLLQITSRKKARSPTQAGRSAIARAAATPTFPASWFAARTRLRFKTSGSPDRSWSF
jgi:hypothetical protein